MSAAIACVDDLSRHLHSELLQAVRILSRTALRDEGVVCVKLTLESPSV